MRPAVARIATLSRAAGRCSRRVFDFYQRLFRGEPGDFAEAMLIAGLAAFAVGYGLGFSELGVYRRMNELLPPVIYVLATGATSLWHLVMLPLAKRHRWISALATFGSYVAVAVLVSHNPAGDASLNSGSFVYGVFAVVSGAVTWHASPRGLFDRMLGPSPAAR